MKTATIPSLRVAPDLRQAAEEVLQEGETLSSFVEQSIRETILRRQTRQEFIARGLASQKEARRTGAYVDASVVVGKLQAMLADAKAAKASAARRPKAVATKAASKAAMKKAPKKAPKKAQR